MRDDNNKKRKEKQEIEMIKAKHTPHPFYGHAIIRRNEQEYIQELMKKYHKHPVNDELKQKVWDELQMEKHLGNITIPFKMAVRRDPSGKYPEYIEIILDTKV